MDTKRTQSKHTSKFSLLKSTTYAREPSENHTQITHNRPQTVPTVHAQPATTCTQTATTGHKSHTTIHTKTVDKRTQSC